MATTSAARRLFGPTARLGFGAARLLRPPSTLRFLSALASRAVPRGEWSELVKKMDESAKHEEKIAHTHVAEQADIEARTSELSAELGELQLSRRMESHLCRSYILGRTSGLTAEDVAQVMARMCYLHEHDEESERPPNAPRPSIIIPTLYNRNTEYRKSVHTVPRSQLRGASQSRRRG